MASQPKIVAVYAEDANMGLALAELANDGWQVEHARNLYKALAAIATTRPDVVIVDVDNLDPKEFAFFDEFRALAPEAFCLLAFSPMCRDKAVQAMQKGADGYVLKPIYVNEICTLVKRRIGPPTRQGQAGDEQATLESLAQLAKGVAHEISNPLTTVSGWLQMLLYETPEDDVNHKTFKLMDEETRRIAKVVSSLQAFAEQRPADRVPVVAGDLVRDVIEEFKSTHPANGLKLDPHIDDDLPTIRVDGGQMRQALKSLLDCAVDPDKPDSTIEVSVSSHDGQALEIRIRNRQHFVEDLHVDRIFEPFYVSEGKSMGMGLAIAQGIVHNHGGRLSVSSSRGEGTEFVASIPANARSTGP